MLSFSSPQLARFSIFFPGLSIRDTLQARGSWIGPGLGDDSDTFGHDSDTFGDDLDTFGHDSDTFGDDWARCLKLQVIFCKPVMDLRPRKTCQIFSRCSRGFSVRAAEGPGKDLRPSRPLRRSIVNCKLSIVNSLRRSYSLFKYLTGTLISPARRAKPRRHYYNAAKGVLHTTNLIFFKNIFGSSG